jgi:serine O-acetyltransferase
VIAADLRHMTAEWDAPPWKIVLLAALKSPFYPALRAMFWIRTGMWLWQHGLRLPAQWCKARAVRAAGVEVHPGARIGPGFTLVHSSGIVVGKDVVAGRDLVLYHGATLGHDALSDGQPRIGDGVRIGSGAKVLGAITVGDGARIGANAVVLKDVPADATAVGLWK